MSDGFSFGSWHATPLATVLFRPLSRSRHVHRMPYLSAVPVVGRASVPGRGGAPGSGGRMERTVAGAPVARTGERRASLTSFCALLQVEC